MSEQGKTNLTVAYGDLSFDFATLPPTTLIAMLRRGVSHFLGSEQASKVQLKIEKAICQGETPEETTARTATFDALSGADKKKALGDFRAANGELVAKWKDEVQADAVKSMSEGTVGVSVRGPAVDPLTTVVNRLAKAEVSNILKANKTAVPKKADAPIEFPNGDKFTMADLVDRRKGHAEHGPRLVKEAKAIVAAQEKAAKKAEGAGLADL